MGVCFCFHNYLTKENPHGKSPEVHGIPLEAFQDPIDTAYRNYEALAGNKNVNLSFQGLAAGRLELTPDKPNTARSVTAVQHNHRYIGDVFTILMAPFDGTGDEKAFQLGRSIHIAPDSRVDRWYSPGPDLPDPALVPRPKDGVDTELWLPLTAIDPHSGFSPVLHAGKLDVLGTDPVQFFPREIVVIGQLGLSGKAFADAINHRASVPPRVEMTTGWHNGSRFGDPHAIYNPTGALQVCGFLALRPEVMRHQHAEVVNALGAVPFGPPRPLPQAMKPVVNNP